jgi:hypothetical protein
MEKTKVKVVVERGRDNLFNVFMDCHDYDFGLAGYGSTLQEAMQDFHSSYDEEKKLCAEEGKTIPDFEFEIRYDVSAFLSIYSGFLSKPGLEKITGINQKQLWNYASGRRKPRPNTVRKIEKNMYHFADSIKQMHFID